MIRILTFIKHHPLKFILSILGLTYFIAFAIHGVEYSGDTPSYINGWDHVKNNDYCYGGRTPSYPLFLGIFLTIFGEYGYYATVVAQIALSLVSIRWFWWLCERLTGSHKISFWATLIYGFYPEICFYNFAILTESLAASCVILWVALLIKLYDKYSLGKAFGFIVLSLFMVYLRPALLYIIVVLLCVGVYFMLCKKGKQAGVVLLSFVLAAGSMYGYCKAVERNTGVFMISQVSLVNDAWILKREDLVKELHFSDPAMQDIQHIISSTPKDDIGWAWVFEMQEKYPIAVRVKFLTEAKRQLGIKWYTHMIVRLLRSSHDTFLSHCHNEPLPYAINCIFRIGWLYDCLVVYTLLLIIVSVKQRRINWLNWTLCLLCYGHIAVMIIGTYETWNRMLVPVMAVFVLMGAQLVSSISVRLNVRRFNGGDLE
jgi:hypothetical protein